MLAANSLLLNQVLNMIGNIDLGFPTWARILDHLQDGGNRSSTLHRRHCRPHQEQPAMFRNPTALTTKDSSAILLKVRDTGDFTTYGILAPVFKVTVFPDDILDGVEKYENDL